MKYEITPLKKGLVKITNDKNESVIVTKEDADDFVASFIVKEIKQLPPLQARELTEEDDEDLKRLIESF